MMTLTAQTLIDPSIARALRNILEMELRVMVSSIFLNVDSSNNMRRINLLSRFTFQTLTNVFLIRYQTNTFILLITVMLMQTVPTPKDHSTAPVKRDTLEMELAVLVK